MFIRALKTAARSAVVLAVTFTSTFVFADPPGRVARLAEYAGDVRIATQYEPWQSAYRNHVVTAGDNLLVSDGGRAELDVGPLQVWLSGGANVYFDRFDDHNLVARLASGVIAVRIRQWEPKDAMRVVTDHGEISFVQPGLYLVTAGDGYNPSVVTTRFGQAELNTFGRVQTINRGDTFAFDQNGARFDRYAYGGVASGGFEGWVVARDRRIDRWESRNRGYFNPWMVGVRDLDDHGYWETHYEYGRVWYPNTVSSSWAPYRYGRWSWVQPWGWTWVDDAPWGFAPFHYGRWVRVGGRWAWCPGSYVGRAVYAPALVTFYGGSGWSVSASVGPTYSWVPLGWNEPFVPWYTYTPNYWRHVNRPYVRNSAEDPWRPPAYVHASVPGAVTTIAAAGFVAGRHVTQNYVRNVPTPDLRSAPPARMGEVVPYFRGARAENNPVGQRREVLPQVPVRGSSPGVVTESAPSRGAPPAYAQERKPLTVQPNTNVLEPRVWQDPNPVVRQREALPGQVRESAPNPQMRDPNPIVRERSTPVVPESRFVTPPNERGAAPQERSAPQSREKIRPAPEMRNGAAAPVSPMVQAPAPVPPPAPAVQLQPAQPQVASPQAPPRKDQRPALAVDER
ncbi:MAG: DUF6600 domain-containing protein, partial [Casimicrobium sp.]